MSAIQPVSSCIYTHVSYAQPCFLLHWNFGGVQLSCFTEDKMLRTFKWRFNQVECSILLGLKQLFETIPNFSSSLPFTLGAHWHGSWIFEGKYLNHTQSAHTHAVSHPQPLFQHVNVCIHHNNSPYHLRVILSFYAPLVFGVDVTEHTHTHTHTLVACKPMSLIMSH